MLKYALYIGDLQTYAFSDTETKFNMADGYVFFEVVEPQVRTYM